MKKFGLIGYPLTHSFSADYFKEKFRKEKISDCNYQLYPIQSLLEFESLLTENQKLIGLNVTIPYKETIIPYLDELDEVAKEIGAVNTIHIKMEKQRRKLVGFNTDVIGFEKMIEPLITPKTRTAIVLGNGGSSKAVCYVLKKFEIKFKIVSRNPDSKMISYPDSGKYIDSIDFIINTTPLGMYPNIHSFPLIDYGKITSRHSLIDLIYNPLESEFLKKGKTKGAKCINGLSMLNYQAESSWAIWNR